MDSKHPAVEVVVDYRLAEYKRVLSEFVAAQAAASNELPNRLLPWNWPFVDALFLSAVVPLVFWHKKWRLGECRFSFSEIGFSRACKAGIGHREWCDIKIVHRLSEAYLIELLAGGALPVPYRVFTPDKKAAFEVLAQDKLGTPTNPSFQRPAFGGR
ncbi:MAG: hypothetical protein ACOVOX_02660 [Burkholderiaceae bacterium]